MIAVIFGGRSCEHDVSVVTGLMTLNALGKSAKAIYIDRGGKFWCGDGLGDIHTYENFRAKGKKQVHFLPSSRGVFTDKGKRLFNIDAAVVCCHGAGGEDGTLQGLLEFTDIPYTCGGVLSGAVGMDKSVMKRVFAAEGLPCTKYMCVTKPEFEREDYKFAEKLKTELSLPLIVKPANLGSSIGISVAHDYEELFDKMRVAFAFDNRVVIENALEDFTEVNCAALGSSLGEVEVSLTEQPVGWKEFLSYEDKYLSKGKEGMKRKMPAEISEDMKRKIEEMTVRAFRAVHASGVARVDFLVSGGDVYVNEINTIPGSLACYLFEHKYSLKQLTQKLIDIAVEEKRAKDALTYTFKAAAPVNGVKK